MRTISATLFCLIVTVSHAFAAAGGGEELGFLAIGFISFGVLIVLFQFVPALLLIGGMVAGLFKSAEKKNDKGLARADKNP